MAATKCSKAEHWALAVFVTKSKSEGDSRASATSKLFSFTDVKSVPGDHRTDFGVDFSSSCYSGLGFWSLIVSIRAAERDTGGFKRLSPFHLNLYRGVVTAIQPFKLRLSAAQGPLPPFTGRLPSPKGSLPPLPSAQTYLISAAQPASKSAWEADGICRPEELQSSYLRLSACDCWWR